MARTRYQLPFDAGRAPIERWIATPHEDIVAHLSARGVGNPSVAGMDGRGFVDLWADADPAAAWATFVPSTPADPSPAVTWDRVGVGVGKVATGDPAALAAMLPPGPKGDRGDVGSAGSPGNPGAKGDQGIQGQVGQTGQTGPAGTNASVRVAMTLGPFHLPNPAANANAQALLPIPTAAGTFGANALDVKMLKIGRIVGAAVVANAPRTAGTLTVRARINGVATALGFTVALDATNPQSCANAITPASGLAFAANAAVGVDVLTAGFAPTTADLTIWLYALLEEF